LQGGATDADRSSIGRQLLGTTITRSTVSSLLSLGRETSHYDFTRGKNFGTFYEMRLAA